MQLRAALVSIIGVTLLVFSVLRLVPGDPVDLMLGENAAPASREKLRAQLELDRPYASQLASFAGRLSRGDLGVSLTRHKPVSSLIAETFPATLALALSAALVSNLAGVPLGVLGAYRPRSRLARATFTYGVLASALPIFWVGPLLIMAFALGWPWLPVSSFRDWSGLVLPTAALGIGLSAHVAQTTRAAVAETLGADFIRVARAKGATETRVLFYHALPVAARPIVAVSALQFGHLLAGAVITETIFDWPGIGRLAYDALMQRDYPTVQGAVLVVTFTYVAINTATDLFLEARP